jgi:hypothetical protein
MVTLSIEIPDASLARLVAAFEAAFGDQGGATDAEFIQGQLLIFARGILREYEVSAAAETARGTAATAANDALPDVVP